MAVQVWDAQGGQKAAAACRTWPCSSSTSRAVQQWLAPHSLEGHCDEGQDKYSTPSRYLTSWLYKG